MFLRLFAGFVTALHMHAARWYREYAMLLGAFVVAMFLSYWCFIAPPRDFPLGEVLSIESGASLAEVADNLANHNVVRSPLAFQLIIRSAGATRSIDAGSYRFAEPLSAVQVALRLVRGEHGMPQLRVTIPEGFSTREIASLLSELISPEFGAEFLREALPHEGFLFPDTYHFSAADTPQSVVAHLRETFDQRTVTLRQAIADSGRSLSDIVTMASLIEREANANPDRSIVAGILWKRLDMDMALQVDAVFAYIFEKNAYAPTFDDLTYDSPYNTYLYRGLPPTPIGNPGLEALTATLSPTKTKYLYYLTGNDGKMYYASTFVGHQANREKYLK